MFVVVFKTTINFLSRNQHVTNNVKEIEAIAETKDLFLDEVLIETSDYNDIVSVPTTAVDVDVIVSEIIDMANKSVSTAKSSLKENCNLMDNVHIEKCLIAIGRWESVSKAESCVKGYLKNPRSFYRYAGKCSTPSSQPDGTYKVTVSLDYGADNSFGASVLDEATVNVYYKINLSTLEIDYAACELDAYSKWKMVS